MSCDCDNGWSAPGVCAAESRLGLAREAAGAVLDMLHVQPWAMSRQFTLLPLPTLTDSRAEDCRRRSDDEEQHYFFCAFVFFFSSDALTIKRKKKKQSDGRSEKGAGKTYLAINLAAAAAGAQGDARTEAAELKEYQRQDVDFG